MDCVICLDVIDESVEKIYKKTCACNYHMCNECVKELKTITCLMCRKNSIMLDEKLMGGIGSGMGGLAYNT
jgi:hypothetical protein